MGKVVLTTGSDNSYKEVYNAYVANGAEKLGSFTGVGSTGDGNGFQEGDVITLPDKADVLGISIAGSTNKAEAIIVKITNGSSSRYAPFYPKSLAKRTNKLTLDDHKQVTDNEYVKAQGTAAKWYQQNSGRKVQDIVNDLIALGKEIQVTKVEPVKTYAFRSTEIIDSNVYTYNFVETA